MLAGRHLGQPGLLAAGLNLQERDQCAHLLLHGREPDQRVQHRLELLEPAHLLGAAQSLELVGHPVDGGLRGGFRRSWSPIVRRMSKGPVIDREESARGGPYTTFAERARSPNEPRG